MLAGEPQGTAWGRRDPLLSERCDGILVYERVLIKGPKITHTDDPISARRSFSCTYIVVPIVLQSDTRLTRGNNRSTFGPGHKNLPPVSDDVSFVTRHIQMDNTERRIVGSRINDAVECLWRGIGICHRGSDQKVKVSLPSQPPPEPNCRDVKRLLTWFSWTPVRKAVRPHVPQRVSSGWGRSQENQDVGVPFVGAPGVGFNRLCRG